MRNLFYLAISLILIACASQNSEKLPSGTAANPASQRLTVFAAATPADAFSEIGEAYTAQHPTVKIDFNFGGSQRFAQQLLEGAPADLFASANQQQRELLLQNGSITQSVIRIFVQNRLILALAPGNPGKINSLQDLVTPGLNVVLAAEDEEGE